MNFYAFTLGSDASKYLKKDFAWHTPPEAAGLGNIITTIERTLSMIGRSSNPGINSFFKGKIKGFNLYK